MLVEEAVAGINGLGVDHDIDRAGFGSFVEDDLAVGLIEATELRGVAEVAVREAREGMGVVGDVGFRGRVRRSGSGDGEDEGGKLLLHGGFSVGGWGLLAACGDVELDLDIVGDNVELGPGAFADREIGAVDGKGAVENAGTALRRKGGRDDDSLGLALDG
ncbi:hypothetical protein CCP3SC15_2300002 [Gammaproteobacteria bacterium]